QYAGRLACSRLAGSGRGLENTAKAGRLAGHNCHGLPMTADTPAVDPGLFQFHRGVVDQVTNLEVVRSVENQIDVFDQFENIGAINVRDHWLDVHGGIDRAELASGSLGLGQVVGHVVLVE